MMRMSMGQNGLSRKYGAHEHGARRTRRSMHTSPRHEIASDYAADYTITRDDTSAQANRVARRSCDTEDTIAMDECTADCIHLR